MDKGTLSVHYIELVVNAGEHLCDGSGVGDHAHGALYLGEVTTGHHGRGLVVDTVLEASPRTGWRRRLGAGCSALSASTEDGSSLFGILAAGDPLAGVLEVTVGVGCSAIGAST